MAKEHSIYWLSVESTGDEDYGSYYYLKDARRAAQILAARLQEVVYINQNEDIVDCVYPKKAEV